MFMTDAHLFQASFFSLSMYEKLRILMVNWAKWRAVCYNEEKIRGGKGKKKQLNWEKVFDRMHDERRQLCCCFDLAVHYRVHLSLWFCDRNIVHEEKERTEEDYVENTKRKEEFPVKCEEPVLLWFLLWWWGRRGRFGLILGQNVLEGVQHFDSAKGFARVVWK